jgi:hypothetical protein
VCSCCSASLTLCVRVSWLVLLDGCRVSPSLILVWFVLLLLTILFKPVSCISPALLLLYFPLSTFALCISNVFSAFLATNLKVRNEIDQLFTERKENICFADKYLITVEVKSHSYLEHIGSCEIWSSHGGDDVDVGLQGWRWRHYVSPKRRYLPTILHGIITQNNNIVIVRRTPLKNCNTYLLYAKQITGQFSHISLTQCVLAVLRGTRRSWCVKCCLAVSQDTVISHSSSVFLTIIAKKYSTLFLQSSVRKQVRSWRRNRDMLIFLCNLFDKIRKINDVIVCSMKMTAFWDVAPCSIAEVYRCFIGAYCLHHQGDERSFSDFLWLLL